MKDRRIDTSIKLKGIKISNFFRNKTFYWLLLFIVLYVVSCKGSDELNNSDSNLLAVVILDYKYEIEFVENNSNTINVLIPNNIGPDEMLRIKNIIKSDKTQSEVYKELAGEAVLSHYVSVMKEIDKKSYKRKLIIRK